MCGIWVLLNKGSQNSESSQNSVSTQNTYYQRFQQLAHRGPDYSSFESYNASNVNALVGFHRLAIVNSSFSGNQPFVIEGDERTVVFVCNGEIYNWQELSAKYGLHTDNDCMIIPLLYMQSQHSYTTFENVVSQLKGEFAFVLLEYKKNTLEKVIVARDEIGVRPLYYSTDCMFFTSEVKGAPADITVTEFPPGNMITHYMDDPSAREVHSFYTIYNTEVTNAEDDVHLLWVENSVTNAVKRRLNASKPFAYLLSGGVDSSLVAALGAKETSAPIKTFCCSIKPGTYQIGSSEEFTTDVGTDMIYARKVADHIHSDHTEVFFTPQEGLDAIPDVIKTIESWDTTSVRASVGQYMVCKWIREHTDCKVVMVGEGPDEVCSSYLFNWYAPDGYELDLAARTYVENIHCYDVKRADRCISRWGLEGRVPLLDPDFIKTYWNIPADLRLPSARGIEKWWLRAAFQKDTDLLLPQEVLMRKKEAFSDGVSASKSWYEMIQDFVEDKVSDEELKWATFVYPYCTPTTKEAYYYRSLFEAIFPGRAEIIPGFWQPKWDANGKVRHYVDPSARTLGTYNS